MKRKAVTIDNDSGEIQSPPDRVAPVPKTLEKKSKRHRARMFAPIPRDGSITVLLPPELRQALAMGVIVLDAAQRIDNAVEEIFGDDDGED